jgi:hypothetical protein
MSLAGKAVLAIWNGIAPEAEDEFVSWHVREHIPERVGLPGFLRGRRYVAVSGHPKYFNFYETEDVNALLSTLYLERLNAPSVWTKAVVSHFTDTFRTICKVRVSEGLGDGAALLAARISTHKPANEFVADASKELFALVRQPGIVALHLLQGDIDASSQQTAEKQLRAEADQVVDWILLIEAVDSASLVALSGDPMYHAALASAGVDLGSGIYDLQFALSASQLPSASKGSHRRKG